MPVTKTAKRALRSSQKKALVNKKIETQLDAAIRVAKKKRDAKSLNTAISLADKAAKKKFIHKNKAARIKSSLSKIVKAKTPTKAIKKKRTKSSKKK
jgi:small subunit ribosomal protein S20